MVCQARQLGAAAHSPLLSAAHLARVLLKELGHLEEAEYWYRRAAADGHHDAESELGALLHQRGLLEEAEHWRRRAADADH